MRPLPYGSEGVKSPTYVKQTPKYSRAATPFGFRNDEGKDDDDDDGNGQSIPRKDDDESMTTPCHDSARSATPAVTYALDLPLSGGASPHSLQVLIGDGYTAPTGKDLGKALSAASTETPAGYSGKAPMARAGNTKRKIEEPSYHGPSAQWEKDEDGARVGTQALTEGRGLGASEEERDVLDN